MNFIRQDLPAPGVDGVVDGMLDPGSVPESGAITRITNVPVSWSGKMLTLYFQEVQGTVLYEATWPVSSHGLDIIFRLPKTILLANLDKDVRVYYRVDDVGVSLPLVFRLEQGFGGSVEFDLSRHNYMVFYTHSEARPPKDIPPFARLQRVMPGATDYSSDNEKVAKVDAYGIVTAQGNGQATISASGGPSGPGSYLLTIKGIDEFHILSPQADWEGAQELCSETGCLQPSSTDFIRLMVFYPRPIAQDLPILAAWGEENGADTAWTFDLVGGLMGSEDMSELLQVAGIKRRSNGGGQRRADYRLEAQRPQLTPKPAGAQ